MANVNSKFAYLYCKDDQALGFVPSKRDFVCDVSLARQPFRPDFLTLEFVKHH